MSSHSSDHDEEIWGWGKNTDADEVPKMEEENNVHQANTRTVSETHQQGVRIR